ncbi:class I SAM-dependent methyltransferase [Nonomuraea sp. NPDC005650]|uniref:class I SAM-dependent methyltransferase n=1 Tax=Nonomuraea sp. NPDC005650 TaxID=3157045 RepID=UPI0033B45D07
MTDAEPWGVVASLVGASDLDGGHERVIAEIGPEKVAGVLVTELLSRCGPAAEESVVRLELTGPDADDTGPVSGIAFDIGFGPEGAAVVEGETSGADVRITYPIADLARALYGTRATGLRRQHELLARWPDDPDPAEVPPLLARRRRGVRAGHALLRELRPVPPALDDLAVTFGSDKWGGVHWYTPHYERHFAPLRDAPVHLLEIGIGGYDDPRAGGGSLRMWQRYFRRGLIYGLDVHDKRLDEPRVRTIRGDQSDSAFLDRLGSGLGGLDIVIDDGSHVNGHVLTSFAALFPHVRPGGWYVIEDLQTSYWPSYGGGPSAPGTTMGLLRSLIDGLHHKEYDHGPGHEPSYTDAHVTGVHLYHNIAFIEKGYNDEPGPARKPQG